MTDKITLSQDEVEHINQRYREAHGEAIGRMAAMSVMGSTIEELERENAELRAELAAIKPDWKDAPDNAEFLTQDEQWTWEFHEVEPHPVETAETEDDYGWWGSRGWCDHVYNKNWRNTLERRPEET